MEAKYGKGNMMTFPLEIAEVQEENKSWNDWYLLPKEAKELQEKVMEVCDKMEYDGSLMYDVYPDRVMVERVVKNICGNHCDNPYYPAMVQVLLCKEMGCRKERRRMHKERMRGYF